jgi:hypothetical protein
MVQITERMAKGLEDMGIFITVVPRKQGFRGITSLLLKAPVTGH